MNDQELIATWQREEQQPFSGWDFSALAGRYHEDTPPWSYDELVRGLLPGADSLLDMGTGGGEKLLQFRDMLPQRTVATEGYAPNIPVAQANLQPHSIEVVAYDSAADTRMPFDDHSFHLIINRHESFDAREVARVLRPDGVFLTQQVGGDDMADLSSVFGMTPEYPDVVLTNFRQQLEQAGLHIETAEEWRGHATFSDVSALVYYLHAVPWEAPDDFSVVNYAAQLLELHHRPSPLAFTISRFVLQARSPKG